MLHKYNDFILKEACNDMTLILEGYIGASVNLMSKLLEIAENNSGRTGHIAAAIYILINDKTYLPDDKIKQNYFDLTPSDDKISFVQNDKIPNGWEDSELDPYKIKSRNDIKIGKIVKYLSQFTSLDPKPNDSDIEKFVNVFKSLNTNESIKFKLVEGEDIAKYYSENSYFLKNIGTLGESCMRESNEDFFDIYSKNPNKVKMLIYIDDNDKIHGRALVWKLKNYPEGGSKYFMDRVYTHKDSDIERFKIFAKDKEWMTKKVMSYSLSMNTMFTFNGKDVIGEIKIKLDVKHDEYPFIDTLCFLDKEKKTLSNLPDKNCYWTQDTFGDSEKCFNCHGDMLIKLNSNYNELCDDCCEGHIFLKKKDIETKWNKKI